MRKPTEAKQALEDNPIKNIVRNHLIEQNIQMLKYFVETNPEQAREMGATLCGVDCKFEHQLIDKIKIDGRLQGKVKDIRIDCAEKSTINPKAKFTQAVQNIPADHCTITHTYLDDLLKKKIDLRKNSFVGRSVLNIDDPKIYNFIWADYCHTPSPEEVERTILYLKEHIQKGILYFTFCGSGRFHGNNSIFKKFHKYSKSKSRIQVIIDTANHFIKKHGITKTKLIYDVIYGGGERGTSTMITIGFSRNIPAKYIMKISNDYQEQERTRKLATNLKAYVLRHGGDYKPYSYNPPKNTKEVKKNKSANDTMIRQLRHRRKVLKRWAKGMDNKEIANDMNISISSVGSVIAQISPSLYKRMKPEVKELYDVYIKLRKNHE